MKSTYVTAGQTGRMGQLNNLIDDARPASYLYPHQQATPDLTVKVEEGKVSFGELLAEFAGGNSPTFTAPTTNPRIDILSLLQSYSDEPLAFSQAISNQDAQINTTAQPGQTFTTPSGYTSMKLKTVAVKLYRGTFEGNPNPGTYSVDIYATDGSGLPTGSILGSVTGNMYDWSGSATEITFTFATAIDLSIATKYALVFSLTFNGAGTNYWVRFAYQDTNIYEGGDQLANLTTKVTTADWFFRVGYFFSDVTKLVRTAGAEAATPVAPGVSPDVYPLAQVYNRVGQTSIRDADTAGQGYINKDLRAFLRQPVLKEYSGTAASVSAGPYDTFIIIAKGNSNASSGGSAAAVNLIVGGVTKDTVNIHFASAPKIGFSLTTVVTLDEGLHAIVVDCGSPIENVKIIIVKV